MNTNPQELADIRARSAAHTNRIASLYDSELTSTRDIERQDTEEHHSIRVLLAIVDRQAGEIAEQTTRANNYEQSSQEHAQRAEELAAKLERVREHAADMERKAEECRVLAVSADLGVEKDNLFAQTANYARCHGKASTYEAEARGLLAILDGK